MAAPLAIGALLKALGPAFKMLLASEAINVARKYIFNGRTKEGRELNRQVRDALQNELGSMGSDDWSKLLGSTGEDAYKKKIGDWMKEILPSAAGTGLNAAGSVWNLKNSIMANALSSAIDSMVTPNEARDWGNPMKAGTSLYTGAKMAQGAMANAIGGAAGNWLNNLSNQIRAENFQNRVTRMMLNENPTGEMYKTIRWAQNSPGKTMAGTQ